MNTLAPHPPYTKETKEKKKEKEKTHHIHPKEKKEEAFLPIPNLINCVIQLCWIQRAPNIKLIIIIIEAGRYFMC